MATESFEQMLTGGHPNSLGRTIELVELVLAQPERLEELYHCYFSNDEVVRLRTSNAIKRVTKAHPDWIVPYLDRLLTEVAAIDQASAQWTLAQLFDELSDRMSAEQLAQAKQVLQRNLAQHHDWIVLNHTMQTLANWSATDEALRLWLKPHLARLAQDGRKSVAKRAAKLSQQLARQAAQ